MDNMSTEGPLTAPGKGPRIDDMQGINRKIKCTQLKMEPLQLCWRQSLLRVPHFIRINRRASARS